MSRKTNDAAHWERITAEHAAEASQNLSRVRKMHAAAIAEASIPELQYRVVVIKHSLKEGEVVLADVEKELERQRLETTDGS